jgi:hypothetical protein
MAEGTAERTDVSPSELQIEYLDAPLVAAFLDHLEHRLPVRGGAQHDSWSLRHGDEKRWVAKAQIAAIAARMATQIGFAPIRR